MSSLIRFSSILLFHVASVAATGPCTAAGGQLSIHIFASHRAQTSVAYRMSVQSPFDRVLSSSIVRRSALLVYSQVCEKLINTSDRWRCGGQRVKQSGRLDFPTWSCPSVQRTRRLARARERRLYSPGGSRRKRRTFTCIVKYDDNSSGIIRFY